MGEKEFQITHSRSCIHVVARFYLWNEVASYWYEYSAKSLLEEYSEKFCYEEDKTSERINIVVLSP